MDITIFSKVRTEKGYVYFAASKFEPDPVELILFATKEDHNPHELNYWEGYSFMDVRNEHLSNSSHYKSCPCIFLEAHQSSCNIANFGENSNVLTIRDLKIVKEELKNVLNWLLARYGGMVVFSPIDDSRKAATKYLLRNLKGFTVNEYQNTDDDGVSDHFVVTYETGAKL